MRAIHDTEFPNSVEATQRLLDEQGADYDNLKVSSLSVKYCFELQLWKNRMKSSRLPDMENICLMILKPKMKAEKNFQNVVAMLAQQNGKAFFS